MATRKQRTITVAMLDALERQFRAEHEREIKASLEACQRGRIKAYQHEYHERYWHLTLEGQMDAIRRLRAMLTDESGVARC